MDDLTPFRLVFSNFNHKNIQYIPDLIEWRTYQTIKKFDFIVLKIGHINTLNIVDFDKLYHIFAHNSILNNKPVKFSVYHDLEPINSEQFNNYCNFSKKMKLLNNNFSCTLAWVYNQEQQKNNFDIIPKNNQDIKYNLYLHQLCNVTTAYEDIKDHLHSFAGFDITGKINNFNQPCDNAISLEFLDFLQSNDLSLLEKIAPEFLDWTTNDKNFKDSVADFCQDGFLIKDDRISPLIYGSFDDFSLSGEISIIDFLTHTYQDTYQNFYKKWMKTFLNSHCSQCEQFSYCKNKNYYWSNLQSSSCSLNLNQTIQMKFDKNTN